jgi:hypothetical protein
LGKDGLRDRLFGAATGFSKGREDIVTGFEVAVKVNVKDWKVV